MALMTSERFARKYGGYEGIKKFIQMCNNVELTLRDIAQAFGMSVPQAHRYREKLFQVQYAPKRGLLDYLEEMKYRDQMNVEKKEKFIEEVKNNITYVNFQPSQDESHRA